MTPAAATARERSPFERARRRSARALRNSGVVAGIGFAIIVLLCVTAPLWADDPNAVDLAKVLQGPSSAHWFGTDSAGRDIFSRVLNGGRLDLFIALASIVLSFIVGGCFGLVLGFFRGSVSEAVMRVLDVVQAFPTLILGLSLLAFVGAKVSTFIIVLAFVNIPVFLRLVRAETLSVRERPFVEAAESVGNSRSRIIIRHIAPNVVTSGLIQMTSSAGQAILIVGGLSFIGVGIKPPQAEWGNMIQIGREFIITGEWWVTMFPGIALVVTVLVLHTIGESFVRGRLVR